MQAAGSTPEEIIVSACFVHLFFFVIRIVVGGGVVVGVVVGEPMKNQCSTGNRKGKQRWITSVNFKVDVLT